MEERIVKIISKLPILEELKKYIISKLTVLDKKQLVEILYNFSTGLDEEKNNKNQIINELKLSIDSFKNTQTETDVDKEFNNILDKLEKLCK